MRIIALLSILLLVGCSATPVKRNFPDVPPELQVACPELQKVQQGAKLSDVVSTVSANYGQYHECNAKVDTWTQWYKNQKQIFESVK